MTIQENLKPINEGSEYWYDIIGVMVLLITTISIIGNVGILVLYKRSVPLLCACLSVLVCTSAGLLVCRCAANVTSERVP